MSDDKLPFKVYNGRKKPWRRLRRSSGDGLEELEQLSRQQRQQEAGDQPPPAAGVRREPSPPSGDPPMRTYRAGEDASSGRGRRGSLPAPGAAGAAGAAGKVARGAGRFGLRRAIKWFLRWAVLWVLISGVLFAVSSSLQSGQISDSANEVLGGGGNMVTSPANVLVLGLDRRPKGSREPGATTSGPARSDSMMLLRVGGGNVRRLSILRDSYAQIPGYQALKINAAYALGGSALAVQTVEQFLGSGVDINHVVIVDFERFPDLIDALGGVNVRVHGKCIRSNFSGVHFALPRGEHHLSGQQALRYARVRKNLCDPSEDDRDRARRQQEVMSSMKGKAFSPLTFVRLPWIAWEAPKAVVTDMSPVSLAAFITGMSTGGDAKTKVLLPSGAGPAGSLIISEQSRARAAQSFSGN
ncbi:MAG: LCP family protein [Thermoleophilaceae bacterium]|nr:LCP family protein [Thermoleophilaceae bacterium]